MKNTDNLSLTIGLALLTISVTAYAENNHLYGVEFETIETSSDFNRRTLELNYGNTADNTPGFGLTGAYHNLEKDGQNFHAGELKARAGYQVNETLHINSGVGFAQVEAKDDSRSKDLVTYHIGTQARFGKQSSAGISHNRDFAYRNQILTNAAGDILTAKTTKAELKLRPAERIRVEGEAEYRELSDNNSSERYKVGAYYGISPSWPWIWAGVEAGKLDYKRQDDGYWTPENHRSVAATFSSSVPVTKVVNLNTSASISRSKQDDSDETSTGYYLSVGSDVELSPNSKLTAGLHHIKSQQDGSDWDETGAKVGINFNHH